MKPVLQIASRKADEALGTKLALSEASTLACPKP